jgi:hypothetical protein
VTETTCHVRIAGRDIAIPWPPAGHIPKSGTSGMIGLLKRELLIEIKAQLHVCGIPVALIGDRS